MSAVGTMPKVAKLIPMLGSDRDGEVVAAVRAIERTLAAGGLDWHVLAQIVATPQFANPREPAPQRSAWRPASSWSPRPTPWRDLARRCAGSARLSDKERGFVQSISTMPPFWTPTMRQRQWLDDIASRLSEAA